MKNIFKLVAYAGFASAFNSGGTASIDFAVLQEAKDNYFDFVLNLVNQVQIPNIGFHHGSMDGNRFHVSEGSKNFDFKAGSSNSVIVSANNLAASFHSDTLRYKELFVTAKGSLDVGISAMSVSVELQVDEQTLPDGKVVPAVKVLNSNVNLPKDHISLHLHGNLIAKFASLFKSLFMGTVRDQITDQVNKALRDAVPPAVNQLIASQKGYTQIYNKMDLDWSISSAPKINSQNLEFGIKGLFFPENEGEVAPSVTPPVMPYKDTTVKSQFQAYASDYLLDSLAYSFFKTNTFKFWTNHDQIPSSSPIQLNTTVLDLFFPGMAAKYGQGKYVDVSYEVRALQNFTSKENSKTMSFNANVGVQFNVEKADGTKEVAIDITVESLFFEFTAIIDGMAVKPNVESASVQDIKVESSTIGDVDMTLLEGLLKQGLDEGRVPFNAFIQKQSIVVPNKLFNLFELSDIQLKYHNGYLEAGLTPTFLPIASERTPWFPLCYNYNEYSQEIIIDEEGKITIIDHDETFLQ